MLCWFAPSTAPPCPYTPLPDLVVKTHKGGEATLYRNSLHHFRADHKRVAWALSERIEAQGQENMLALLTLLGGGSSRRSGSPGRVAGSPVRMKRTDPVAEASGAPSQ